MTVHLPRHRLREDESGAILVWTAVMMVVLLGISAFAIDLGYAYAVKRQLSATADSASLAGAQEAGLKFAAQGVGGCGDTLNGLIEDAVNANHAANNPAGSTGDPGVTIECKDEEGNPATGTDASSVSVKVDEASSLDTWFGRVLGVDSLAPSATATARVFGSANLSGLRPFIVCLKDAQDARDDFTVNGTTPLYQSYYNQFIGGKTPKPPANEVYTSATWDGAAIRKGNDNHGLSTGDYVRLVDVQASGGTQVTDSFFYVTKLGPKEFSVSPTNNPFSAVIATTAGFVDVYRAGTPDVVASWSGNQVTVTSGSVPADGTDVWVQGTSGTGVTDGKYVLTKNAGGFQLSTGGVVSVEGSNGINVFVLSTPNPTGGVACNPPGASGNWGYSKFDLGNKNFQASCLIKFGYGGRPGGSQTPPKGDECTAADPDNPFVDVGAEDVGALPADTGGDPGNNIGKNDAPLIEELIKKGDPILLPVGKDWDPGGSGSGAKYDGRGALSVRLCGFAFPGSEVDPTAPTLPSANTGGSYFDPDCGGDASMYLDAISSVPPTVTKETTLVIQWRFVDYVGGFQGQPSDAAAQCPLDSCVATLQLLE